MSFASQCTHGNLLVRNPSAIDWGTLHPSVIDWGTGETLHQKRHI